MIIIIIVIVVVVVKVIIIIVVVVVVVVVSLMDDGDGVNDDVAVDVDGVPTCVFFFFFNSHLVFNVLHTVMWLLVVMITALSTGEVIAKNVTLRRIIES